MTPPEDYVRVFAARIRELQFWSGKSAEALSELIGLPPNSIGRYKRGKRMPSLYAIVKIADYFGVSVDYLLGRGEK